MKRQIILTATILAAVALFAFARPSDTAGKYAPRGVSLQDAYKGMMQMIPFTFSKAETPPPKPVS